MLPDIKYSSTRGAIFYFWLQTPGFFKRSEESLAKMSRLQGQAEGSQKARGDEKASKGGISLLCEGEGQGLKEVMRNAMLA